MTNLHETAFYDCMSLALVINQFHLLDIVRYAMIHDIACINWILSQQRMHSRIILLVLEVKVCCSCFISLGSWNDNFRPIKCNL